MKDSNKDKVEEKPNVVTDSNKDKVEEKPLRGARCQKATGPKESFQSLAEWPIVTCTHCNNTKDKWRRHIMTRPRILSITFIAVGSAFLRMKTMLPPRPKRGCSSWRPAVVTRTGKSGTITLRRASTAYPRISPESHRGQRR